ncbi:hypothetical protein PBY51_004572 [Eleginops maclovinus]|nr:hypothetical protein PBY51_004572 [Eleginops maclovinus]
MQPERDILCYMCQKSINSLTSRGHGSKSLQLVPRLPAHGIYLFELCTLGRVFDHYGDYIRDLTVQFLGVCAECTAYRMNNSPAADESRAAECAALRWSDLGSRWLQVTRPLLW